MGRRNNDMDNIFFLLDILRIIPRQPRKITANEVHQKMQDLGYERNIRSIQRQLKALVERFPELICDERDREYSYCWDKNAPAFVVSGLTEQQSLLLKLAEQQLAYMLPANLFESMKPFFTQADHNIHFESKNKQSSEWLDKICAMPPTQPLIPAKIKEGVFEAVSTALYNNQYLNINYKTRADYQYNATILPLALVQQQASQYLVARYKDKSDNRLFALHRIQSAEISTLHFERPTDFNLKEYQKSGELGFWNEGLIKLSFCVDKGAGYHLTETKLSEDQVILEETDEYYRIQATVADNEMLEWWIRSFADNVWDIVKEKI